MPKVEEPNDKLREQIEEILEQEEKRAPVPIRVARPVTPRKVRSTRSGSPIWYPTPEKLILAGLVLLIVAAVTRNAVLPLTLGGFAIAGLGYYMLVMRKRRGKFGAPGRGRAGVQPEQYWRGRPVTPSRDEKPSTPVKKRDGNVLEFPEPLPKKRRKWFGKNR